MTTENHIELRECPFILDLEGEGFVPEPEEDSSDCAINVKETPSKRQPEPERLDIIELPSAVYIPPSIVLRNVLSTKQEELYRNTVLDVRRYLYNSIVCEDFCVSLEVNRNEMPTVENISDVTDESADATPLDVMRSPEAMEYTIPPSPSATIVDEGIHGSRKAPRIDLGTHMSNSPHRSRPSDDKNHSADAVTPAAGKHTTATNAPLLSGLSTKAAPDDINGKSGSLHNVDATLHDTIKFTVNIKKLSNIVTDIEHVQMCSSVPFPRLFRLSRENLSSGLVAAGRRYFLASESAKRHIHSAGHTTFLAHLYRRKRSICFFCGFLKCPRTMNSKQQCRSMRCHRCSFSHQWGRNKCHDKGSMVQYYLRTNDWRNRRVNPWYKVRDSIRKALRCFYCGKVGEANFRCRKIACPYAANTIEYRCLELLGKPRLDRLVRERPEMFKHLRDPNYVFK